MKLTQTRDKNKLEILLSHRQPSHPPDISSMKIILERPPLSMTRNVRMRRRNSNMSWTVIYVSRFMPLRVGHYLDTFDNSIAHVKDVFGSYSNTIIGNSEFFRLMWCYDGWVLCTHRDLDDTRHRIFYDPASLAMLRGLLRPDQIRLKFGPITGLKSESSLVL